MIHPVRAAGAGLLLLLAGGFAAEAPAPQIGTAPVVTDAALVPVVAAAQAATKTAFADPLTPGASHALDAALAGAPLAEAAGGVTWSANPGVTITAAGATATAPGGAHHAIPLIAGTIRVQAEVRAAGSGFTAICLGRGDLSGDFWVNSELILLVSAGGYALQAGAVNLVPRSDSALLHGDAPDHLDLLVDTVARTVTVRINATTVLDAVALPPATRTDALTAAGFRFNQPVTAGVPLVSAWRVDVASMAASGFAPLDHADFFVTPGQAATLRWRVASAGPTAQVPYTISGYDGRPVASGSATLDPDGTVAITRVFARGYAEVSFPAAHQVFGVVALEPQRGPADAFFCMDSGLSWLEPDALRRTALVRSLARCGIAMSRERLGLGAVNPEPATYHWEGGRAFDHLRAEYAANHVGVLEILEGGAKHHGMIGASPFAQDLPAVATAWTAIATHWRGAWGAVEVDNEPDLKTVPADQYVPSAKAVSYALAAAGATAPVVAGVFATIPPGPYFDTCAANGMLADADVVSFHSYDRAPGVEAMVAKYRAWMATQGVAGMPLWHSECGWPWGAGPGRPVRDQDARSAVEIAAKAIESKACGVARYFPFVYVSYEEGPKNFGMMGRDATPLRSMAAYALAASALGGRHYLGDLRDVGAPVSRARVFSGGDDGSCVAVLYSGEPAAAASVHLPFAVQRACGADGRELALVAGTVPLPDGLTYVWIDPAVAATVVETATGAARLCEIAAHPPVHSRLASPVVLQFLMQQTPSRRSARRYLVDQEAAHALPIHVRITNLSAAPVTVSPALCLPGGMPVAATAVEVPAQGSSEVAWTVDAVASLDIAETRFITVTAQTPSGAQPGPLAIPLVMDGSLEQHLARHTRQRALPIAELTRWHANVSAQGRTTFQENGGGWRMTAVFPASQGNWTYPKFTLPERLDGQRDAGFIIRARILKTGSPAAILANPDGPVGFWCPDLFPADGEWHVVYVPFAEFKPGPNGAGMQNTRLDVASWDTLAIGMGSAAAENGLEISHVIVVGGAGGK
ncbi:MAG: hypothetical protein H0X38_06855 [Planctomycetes bacterium]|nr:hypothetical protein [Planctomycetota bacterium]